MNREFDNIYEELSVLNEGRPANATPIILSMRDGMHLKPFMWDSMPPVADRERGITKLEQEYPYDYIHSDGFYLRDVKQWLRDNVKYNSSHVDDDLLSTIFTGYDKELYENAKKNNVPIFYIVYWLPFHNTGAVHDVSFSPSPVKNIYNMDETYVLSYTPVEYLPRHDSLLRNLGYIYLKQADAIPGEEHIIDAIINSIDKVMFYLPTKLSDADTDMTVTIAKFASQYRKLLQDRRLLDANNKLESLKKILDGVAYTVRYTENVFYNTETYKGVGLTDELERILSSDTYSIKEFTLEQGDF